MNAEQNHRFHDPPPFFPRTTHFICIDLLRMRVEQPFSSLLGRFNPFSLSTRNRQTRITLVTIDFLIFDSCPSSGVLFHVMSFTCSNKLEHWKFMYHQTLWKDCISGFFSTNWRSSKKFKSLCFFLSFFIIWKTTWIDLKIRSRIDYEDWLRENEDFSDANGYNILDPKKALQCTVFQWDNPRDKPMELSFLVLGV